MASPRTDRRFGLVGNTAYKAPATVVATSNVTQSGEQTIDGYACLESNALGVPDRVLCVGQTDATQNGLWDVSTSAWTRSVDSNGNYDLTTGTQVYLQSGTHAGQVYVLTTTGSITVGTTALTWSQSLTVGFLVTLAMSAGSSLVGFIASGVGAVIRTVQSKLRDQPSIVDYGADPTGATDCSAAITAALLAEDHLWVPYGNYKINTVVEVASGNTLDFAGGAVFLAGTNGMTMLKATTASYSTQILNARLDGNGKTNVTGIDLTNYRVGSALTNLRMQNMEIGAIFRAGCFGLNVESPSSTNCHYPIRVMANCSNMVIHNPSVDNEAAVGGDGTGTGIEIQYGSGSNLGVRIIGGYSQGFDIGVLDAAFGTKVEDTYFEDCTTADISATAARGSVYTGTQHFGPSGPACFKLRNSDAIFTGLYTMASGARTVVHDVDNTNTNCVYDEPGSNAFYNVPVNTAADATSKSFMKKVALQSVGSFTPVLIGTSTAGAGTYSVQTGNWTKIGDLVSFNLTMTWSAHTGTGNMLVNGVPKALEPASFTPTRIFALGMDGIPWTGPGKYAYFNGTSTTPNGVQISVAQESTAGGTTLIPIDGSGSMHIAGSYRMTS